MTSNKRFHEMIRFGVTGIAGFIVDAGLIAIFTQAFGLGPIVAQLIGFTAAVTVTWLINRQWTFAEHASDKWFHELTRYVAANSVGALVTNSIYILLVLSASIFTNEPVLAVAVGAVVGLFFNFTASRAFVFRNIK